MSNPVLCYIEGAWAYFTTQSLESQWGDDWNDAPYEHNAGQPYDWRETDGVGCVCLHPQGSKRYGPKGCGTPDHEPTQPKEKWQITRVAFTADLHTPANRAGSESRYSVEQINRGEVAWLSGESWSQHGIVIHAGTPLTEFCRLVWKAGGATYLKKEPT